MKFNLLDKKSSLVKASLAGHGGTTVAVFDIVESEEGFSDGATAGVIAINLALILQNYSFVKLFVMFRQIMKCQKISRKFLYYCFL